MRVPVRFLPVLILAAACRNEPAPVTSTTAPPQPAAQQTTTREANPPPASPQAPPVVNGPRLEPVDEGASDPSFAAFRTKFLQAVEKRDADAVIAMTDPVIRTSFGEGGGEAEFRRLLQRPEIWLELEQIVKLGGKFGGEGDQRQFWAPYVFSAWPESRDAFTTLAVIGTNVPLHEQADAGSPAIATLSYDLVERLSAPAAEQHAFEQVKTADGRTGYVAASELRSPVGYRAGFMRRGGTWKLTALVAGD